MEPCNSAMDPCYYGMFLNYGVSFVRNLAWFLDSLQLLLCTVCSFPINMSTVVGFLPMFSLLCFLVYSWLSLLLTMSKGKGILISSSPPSSRPPKAIFTPVETVPIASPPRTTYDPLTHQTYDELDDTVSFDEYEEEALRVNYEFTVVGKVLVTRPYRKQAVTQALVKAWNCNHGIEVLSLEDDRFIFHFQHPMDLRNVMSLAPWSVNGNALLLERWNIDDSYTFNRIIMWVQLNGVPLAFRRNNVIFNLASKLGEVHQMQDLSGTNNSDRTVFYRCRITFDIARPLKKYLFLQRCKGQRIPVIVGYERLPNYCLHCGSLLHDCLRCVEYFDLCENHIEMHHCDDPHTCEYRPQLRLPNLRATVPPAKLLASAEQVAFPQSTPGGVCSPLATDLEPMAAAVVNRVERNISQATVSVPTMLQRDDHCTSLMMATDVKEGNRMLLKQELYAAASPSRMPVPMIEDSNEIEDDILPLAATLPASALVKYLHNEAKKRTRSMVDKMDQDSPSPPPPSSEITPVGPAGQAHGQP